MIKAILFDLDGTLLDTLGDIRANVNAMLRAYGYPEITRAQTTAYVGDGALQLIERSLPAGAANAEECYEYFRARFETSANELTKLFEREEETLARLKGMGLKLGIVTNKTHAATVRLVEKFFPENTFDFVHGEDGSFPCKPDPTLARFAALSMRVAPAECVFVGDGETDVKTARAAGMHGVACLWGYRTKEQLAEVGATQFARDYAELEKIVKKFCENY